MADESKTAMKFCKMPQVNHDREFVLSVATRIIELKPDGIEDFTGTCDDYLLSQDVGPKKTKLDF